MTYENAPSTKMMNTHCMACARPLVDAESVTAGLGPICRKRYGRMDHLTAEQRTRANQLISACARLDATAEIINAAIIELALLGMTDLAEKIVGGKHGLTVTLTDEAVDVRAPYSATFLANRGRGRWVGAEKITRYTNAATGDAVEALTAAFSERGVVKTVTVDGAVNFVSFAAAMIMLRGVVANAPAEAPAAPTGEQIPAAKIAHECGWTKVNGGWGANVPAGKRPMRGQIVRVTNRAGKVTIARIATVGRAGRWGTPCTIDAIEGAVVVDG